MADRTRIEWTDATWNPNRGCTRVSEGCRNCYAEVMAARFSDPGQWGHGLAQRVTLPGGGVDHRWTGKVAMIEDQLDQPLRWKRRRRIFVNSTSDLFHEAVPDDWIDRVFAVMALTPWHTYQVLTKRPERARNYLGYGGSCVPIGARQAAEAMGYADPGPLPIALPNVWLGTSVEDQASADQRIPHLLATPAAVRFLSVEPMLGPVDILRPALGAQFCTVKCKDGCSARGHEECPESIDPAIDWVICGGESGPGARPMHPDWPRSLRDQCVAAGVPFFFKQWGEWAPLDTSADRKTLVKAQTQRAQWHDACGLIIDTPRTEDALTFFSEGQVFRIGKRAAGRHLDGRIWDEMPEVAHG